MDGRRAHTGGWKTFALAASAAAVATGAFGVVLATGVGGEPFLTQFDDIGEAVAAFLAAGACAWTARRSLGQFKRGWWLLAASAAAWAAGQVAWTYYEVLLGVAVPVPSAADAGFLLAVPLAIAGVLSFMTAPRGTAEHWRAGLDGLNMVMALTYTAWALGLKQIVFTPGSLAERATGLAYPIGDILTAAVLILAIRRATRRRHGQLLFLLGGLAANSVADSVFSYITATQSLPDVYNVIGTGWVAGYLTITLAAFWPVSRRDVDDEKRPIDMWQIALPWAVLLAAAVSTLFAIATGERSDQFQTMLAVAMAMTTIVGQVLSHKDSLALLATSRRSEALLAEVVAQAPIGIARTDLDFTIIGSNESLGQLLRAEPASIAGSPIGRYLSPEARAQVFAEVEKLQNGTATRIHGDAPVACADGHQVWSHWTATAVRNPTSQIEYFLFTFEDITAEHEAGEAARAHLQSLESLNAIKAGFLERVSRQFKDAVRGILELSRQMSDSPSLDPRMHTLASGIYADANRLDGIVNELVSVDRVHSRHARTESGQVDINVIIRRLVDEQRPAAGGTKFTLRLSASLPPVRGDGSQLAQVLRTLLHKAMKYSPDGGEITISSEREGGGVEVTVADQGPGSRPEFGATTFDQGHADVADPILKLIGTGLGIGIARQIVEVHGGRLWVARTEGAGFECHFTVPVGEVADERMAEAAQVLV